MTKQRFKAITSTASLKAGYQQLDYFRKHVLSSIEETNQNFLLILINYYLRGRVYLKTQEYLTKHLLQ